MMLMRRPNRSANVRLQAYRRKPRDQALPDPPAPT
jgi:hypothetical protein